MLVKNGTETLLNGSEIYSNPKSKSNTNKEDRPNGLSSFINPMDDDTRFKNGYSNNVNKNRFGKTGDSK